MFKDWSSPRNEFYNVFIEAFWSYLAEPFRWVFVAAVCNQAAVQAAQFTHSFLDPRQPWFLF